MHQLVDRSSLYDRLLQVKDAELVAVVGRHAWNVDLVEERFGTRPRDGLDHLHGPDRARYQDSA